MKPHLQSLVVANQVFQDKLSNNFVIAGTFNTLRVRQNLPVQVASPVEEAVKPQRKWTSLLRSAGNPWIFFSVTDIVGKVQCSIRYVDLKDYQVLFSTAFTIESNDRLATLESRLELPVLPIVGLGQYSLEFLADDEMIGSLRIIAVPDESESGEAKNE